MNKRFVVLASLALTSLGLTLMMPKVLQGYSSEIAQVDPTNDQTDEDSEASQTHSTTYGVNATDSLEIKDTNYPVPSRAYFVSPNGSDTNSGSQASPWRTLKKAIESAPQGSVIAIRGGTYREGDLDLNKKLTLQAYPHEKVWLKGSLVVTDWVAEADLWRKDNWNYQFSPENTDSQNLENTNPSSSKKNANAQNSEDGNRRNRKNANAQNSEDGNRRNSKKNANAQNSEDSNPKNSKKSASSKTIDPAYPMAAYRDMLFIDGKALQQVTSKGEVGPGKFYVDDANNKLYIGDDPSGKTVESTAFEDAFNMVTSSTSSVVRGLGFTHYAENGVTVNAPNVDIENNTFAWNAVRGLMVRKPDAVVRGNTFSYNGRLGCKGNSADRLLFEKNTVRYNNIENFASYDAAGAKFGESASLVLRDNVVERNNNHGLWVDVSSANATIVRNIVRQNRRNGIFFELSNRAIIASNLLVDNGEKGISVHDSSNARVYNNTMVNNAVGIHVQEGPRTNSNREQVAAGITWKTTGNVIKNNILLNTKGVQGKKGLSLLLSILNNTKTTNNQMVADADNNAYYRASSNTPEYVVRYIPKIGSSKSFETVSDFSSSTGFEKNALAIDDVETNPFFVNEASSDYRLKSDSPATGRGEPLPADIASAIGTSAGVTKLGVLSPASSGQTSLQDVQGHWAQAYVQALATKNIISGFPDGTFRPNAPVTRAEFAAIVTKAFTSAAQQNDAVGFQDIPKSFWGYRAIQTASQGGFLAGYPNGTFQPSQQIPRVQVLVSLASGLGLSSNDTDVLSFYRDVSQIPAYATNKVAAATQQEIVVNYPTASLLNPNREATRAEVAAFVYQALVDAGKAEQISSPYVVSSN